MYKIDLKRTNAAWMCDIDFTVLLFILPGRLVKGAFITDTANIVIELNSHKKKINVLKDKRMFLR